MVEGKRQAGVHRFEGIYAFEIARRLIGDELAERLLLCDYESQKRRSRSANFRRDELNVRNGDRVHVGF